MRWFGAVGAIGLVFSLACSGDPTDLLDDVMGEAGDEAGDGDEATDGDDAEEEEEEDEPKRRGPVPADCSVDMIGLLVGAPGFKADGKEHPGPVQAHKKPNHKSKVVAELTKKGFVKPGESKPFCRADFSDEACSYFPYELESRALPVYEERDGWALVGLGRGGSALQSGTCRKRMWVELRDGLSVTSVEDRLTGKLNYMREGWDGELLEEIDGEPTDTFGVAQERIPVDVKEIKQEGDSWWARVDVLDKPPCDGEPEVRASGWVPLYDAEDRLQMWFWTDC